MSRSSAQLAEPVAVPEPDEPAPPLVEVNPSVSFLGGPAAVLRNVRAHWGLVASFVSRDVRVKYRDSALGYVWSLLEPLMLAGVYYFLYVVLSHASDPRQPLWIILGVITWQTFAKALTGGLSCLTRNESLIKQVYFPRELFAMASAGSELVLGLFSLAVIAPLMLYYGIAPTVFVLIIPLGLLLAVMLGVGIGMALAPMNAIQRDIDLLMRFVTRVGVFLAPVLWTIDNIPKSRTVLVQYIYYNPMTLPISLVRDGVIGQWPPMPVSAIIASVASAFGSLWLGAAVFKRYEARVIKKL